MCHLVDTVVREVVAQTVQCAACSSAVVLKVDGETVVRCPDGTTRPVRLCPLLDRLGRDDGSCPGLVEVERCR